MDKNVDIIVKSIVGSALFPFSYSIFDYKRTQTVKNTIEIQS